METLPDLSSLSHEQKDELIRTLFQMVQRLTARAEELEALLYLANCYSRSDRRVE